MSKEQDTMQFSWLVFLSIKIIPLWVIKWVDYVFPPVRHLHFMLNYSSSPFLHLILFWCPRFALNHVVCCAIDGRNDDFRAFFYKYFLFMHIYFTIPIYFFLNFSSVQSCFFFRTNINSCFSLLLWSSSSSWKPYLISLGLACEFYFSNPYTVTCQISQFCSISSSVSPTASSFYS